MIAQILEKKPLQFNTKMTQVALLSLSNDAFIFPSPNVLKRALEMALRAVKIGIGLIFARVQVRMDELDQPVEVLGGDGLVLLVEIVNVTVENLDK